MEHDPAWHWEGATQQSREVDSEQGWSKHTALLHTTMYTESLGSSTVKLYRGLHFVVKGFDDGEKSWWATQTFQYCEKTCTAYIVECFCQIYKNCVERFLLLDTFFLQLTVREDHVQSRTIRAETSLTLWKNTIGNAAEARQDGVAEQLPNYTQEGDASVIVTVMTITLVFVQCHNVRVAELVWESATLKTFVD